MCWPNTREGSISTMTQRYVQCNVCQLNIPTTDVCVCVSVQCMCRVLGINQSTPTNTCNSSDRMAAPWLLQESYTHVCVYT